MAVNCSSLIATAGRYGANVIHGFPGDGGEHIDVAEAGGDGAFAPENAAMLADAINVRRRLRKRGRFQKKRYGGMSSDAGMPNQ